MNNDLDALEAKLKADSAKLARMRKDLDARWEAFRRERHRRALVALVGVKEGVRVRFRIPAGEKSAVLNDRCGTLLKVRRTRGDVDFGEVNGDSRPWDFSLKNLIPASEPRGFTIMV
jgi:hypothetical protein